MTTIAAEPIEALDLSDLDLLDETGRHLCCLSCYPAYSLMALDPFVALCGRQGLAKGRLTWDISPDDCQGCRAVEFDPCARCGR